jgi:cell wall-associated NlpC family hydrolase
MRLTGRTRFVRSRTAFVLIGLALPFAAGGTLSASPVPDALPGGTSTAPAPSQAPAPAPGAVAAPPATPPVPTSLVGPQTRGSFMKQYQSRLRAKGQKIKVTGRWDKATETATKRLQKAMGLPPNGLVDASFLTSIGIKMRGVAGSSGPLPSPASNAAVVQVAMQYIGVPYRWGGTTPAGFDCSGLMVFSYRQIGKSLPRTTWDQWGAFPRVPFDQLAPGDLVFFRNLGHMGMYIGDGNVLHAPQTGRNVMVFPLAQRMHDYVGATRP